MNVEVRRFGYLTNAIHVAPRYSVLGANAYSDPGYMGEPVIREHRMAIPCLIEDSLSVAVAYRISADFRLRAHSIIRVWCVLNVQLTKK